MDRTDPADRLRLALPSCSVSRDDGFPRADIDVKLLRDPKVRRLRRVLTTPGDAAAAEHLYLAVLLSSWETGYRVSIDDAVAFEVTTPERLEALRTVGLLDANDKIPAQVWEHWFKPAWDRREKRSQGGIEGNRRRWHSDRAASLPDSLPDSLPESAPESAPESPSLPTSHPSIPTSAERFEATEWTSFLEAWKERFKYLPRGAEDVRGSQRSILWPIVSGFPSKSADWCRAAPSSASAYDVVGYVRSAWRREIEGAA